jgi:general secretion pathway protein B
MSFILDALKKSESERQRTNTPGIAHIAEGGKRTHAGKWLWIVAILLIVNAAVLAALMLRSDKPGTTPIVQTKLPTEAQADPTPAATRFSDIVADAKRSQPPATRAEGGARIPTEKASDSAPEPASERSSVAAQGVSDTLGPTSNSVTDGLPGFNELRAAGLLQLADMHLDIHVYSEQPADRFVFVNMSKYKERATLSEGPLVREITRDGVVLEFSGHTFLLPRE